MTSARHARRIGAMAVTLLATVGLAPLAVAPRVASAAAPQFGLVQQTFNVAAGGRVRLVLTLPAGVDPDPTDFVVDVIARDVVRTRAAVAASIDGDLPDALDRVRLLPLAVPRPQARQMVVDVPVEIGNDAAGALLLDQPGVHPVTVRLVESDTVTAELTTFVNRVPTDEEAVDSPDDAMPIAIAVATTSPVILDDDVRPTVDAATRRELTALSDLLTDIAVPVSVRVPPGQLAALQDGTAADKALGDRLRTLLGEQEVLSTPVLPLDVSHAAQAGQEPLYTQWLRDGEDALATVVDSPARRTLTFVDQPLSREGGLLLRNLGTRMLVLPTSIYDVLPGTLGGFTDSTQLVQIRVDDTSTVDADVVDRTIAPELAQVTTAPQLHAVQLVADLLAARQQVEDQGGDVRRHSILLGTPDLSLPSPTGFAAFADLLADTPGLEPVTVDELSARTDQLLGPEGPVVVDLPEDVDGDIGARIDLRNALGLEAISTGSMLPEDDPRTKEWARLIDTLPTGALSDTRADAVAADMRAEFEQLRTSVGLPDGFSFRLTGTTGSVPVTLRNAADIPLTVRVRMSSPKLVFPPDQTVVLAPNSVTQVSVDVEARSNGESSATLEVFTPTGDVLLGDPVVLSANVTTLTGVGYLLTGAALLVLLTWWFRHIRRNRRGRQAAAAAVRHPALQRAEGQHTEGDDLSPDAATSTLPPS
ncbi:MAG: DUF6049 family protein [Ilumatobacteraceae bacterium]